MDRDEGEAWLDNYYRNHTAGFLKEIEQKSRWYGRELWDNTKLDRMEYEDIPLVGDVYMRALIPVEFFDVMSNPRNEAKIIKMIVDQRGGMLNRFAQKPFSLKRHREYPSVEEELQTRIPEGFGRQRNKGVRESSYRGQLLVSQDDQKEVLAWGTSTLSNRSMRNRTPENDDAVSEVEHVLNKIRLEAGLKLKNLPLMKESSRVMLIDTIQGRVKGAADLLLQDLCEQAEDNGYKHMLLWRNKRLNVLDKDGHMLTEADLGNNEQSYRFFSERGFREFGTQLSPFAAIRGQEAGENTDKTYYVQPVRAYMFAKVKTVKKRIEEIIESAKDRLRQN